jgi:hypothetical protein
MCSSVMSLIKRQNRSKNMKLLFQVHWLGKWIKWMTKCAVVLAIGRNLNCTWIHLCLELTHWKSVSFYCISVLPWSIFLEISRNQGLSQWVLSGLEASWVWCEFLIFVKNGVFWDVMLCGSCKNWRFGGTEHLLHQGDKNRELGTTLAVTSNQCMLRRNTKYFYMFLHGFH